MAKKSVLAVLIAMGIILSSGIANAELALMKSKYDVTFYGYIKAESVYNDVRGLSDSYLLFAYPDAQPFKDQNTLNFTARQSRFGFMIGAPGPTSTSKVNGVFEMDFYGGGWTPNKYAPHLRRAFLELKSTNMGFLAGLEWMLMSPLYPHVSNYTAGAGLGNLGYRMPQMRVTVGNQYRFAASVGEKIEGDLTTADFNAGERSGVPDFQWQLGYFGKNGLMVAYSGHYGEEKWDDAASSVSLAHEPENLYHEVTFESWSQNISVNIPIGKRLAISGEYYMGVNLDGWYTGSIFGQGVGINEDGDRIPVRDTGFWVELMVKPVNKVTWYLGYGQDDPNDKDLENGAFPALPGSILPAGLVAFTKNQMYYSHLFYEITDSLKVSLEVMKIRTEYKNDWTTLDHDKEDTIHGNDGELMRYDLAFWFFF